VVRLFDYTSSFDGAELIYNGVKGEDWSVVDGKPRPSDAVIQARMMSQDLLRTRGIDYGGANFLVTISALTVAPRYGEPIDFKKIPEVAALSYNDLDREIVARYGTTTVDEIIENAVAAGTMKDMSGYNALVPRMVPTMPTSIQRINTNIQQLAAADWAPKLVFAKDDADYRALKAQALAAFKAAGLDELNKWMRDTWAEAQTKAAGFGL